MKDTRSLYKHFVKSLMCGRCFLEVWGMVLSSSQLAMWPLIKPVSWSVSYTSQLPPKGIREERGDQPRSERESLALEGCWWRLLVTTVAKASARSSVFTSHSNSVASLCFLGRSIQSWSSSHGDLCLFLSATLLCTFQVQVRAHVFDWHYILFLMLLLATTC